MDHSPVASQNEIRSILIADNHGVLRQALRDWLNVVFPDVLIWEADNGKDAVSLSLAHKPDVVLMDIAMPEMDGIDATRSITRDLPDTHVVMLTLHEGAHYRSRSREAGARSYITKSRMGSELIPTLMGIIENKNRS